MLECVPNFSEGTDQNVIDEIVSSIKSCKILDVHSDDDHNRTVVTMVGEPKEVEAGAFELCQSAINNIDINKHSGVHPFIGAVDVIPLIPLSGSSMHEAKESAYNLGDKLWKDLRLPVYFYGQAAKSEDRVNLPHVRKGGYALLKKEIDEKERQPDFGIGLHKTAGAVAVGARDFLIAFNVNIGTTDVLIAESIGKNIREKYSGLSGVRALGLYLKSRNICQVSVNLTDCNQTSLKHVYDKIKYWAKEYKVNIIESELIGLVPQAAVFKGMKDYLGLNDFSIDKILVEKII
ncbi:glutamate formimidoyltransferase [Candidatus Margulisiibacteriota bacterium]